jgi:RNA polymerase sigma-70 factor (ECF subfamily)
MSSDDSTDVFLATQGDPDALARLLERHGPAVRGFIRSQIPQQSRSLLSEDDVMQESYAGAFLSIGQFDRRGSFPAWLQKIARNNLLDAIKALSADCRGGSHRRVETEHGADTVLSLFDVLSDSGTTPSRGAMRSELRDVLGRALAELPDAYREVVQLYDLECRTADQVAEMLNCSPGAVYMRRARAREMLREVLGSFSDFT